MEPIYIDQDTFISNFMDLLCKISGFKSYAHNEYHEKIRECLITSLKKAELTMSDIEHILQKVWSDYAESKINMFIKHARNIRRDVKIDIEAGDDEALHMETNYTLHKLKILDQFNYEIRHLSDDHFTSENCDNINRILSRVMKSHSKYFSRGIINDFWCILNYEHPDMSLYLKRYITGFLIGILASEYGIFNPPILCEFKKAEK